MAVTFSKHLSADWASLPLTALILVLHKLLEPADHIRFAAVCKEWSALAKEFEYTTEHGHKLLPMLMIPTGLQGKQKLYSISEGKIYNNAELPLPNNSKRWCSNGHGWMATVDLLDRNRLAITLVNPFKRAVMPIHLPPLDFNVQLHTSKLSFPKVILRADPVLNPDTYVVIAIYDRVRRSAFIKGGQNCWTYVEQLRSFLTDAIFHKSQVYAVGNWGWITSFDVNSNSSKEKLLTPRGYQFSRFASKGYLVESTKGELLHVRRFLKRRNETEERFCRFDDKDIWCLWTESFKVYKLLFNERHDSIVQQVEVKSLGDEALFVGDNYSVSVLASNFPGCQPNSIYYTDDLIEYREVRLPDDGPSDMGIFNLDDETITQHYPLHSWQKNFPPALWIVPYFNGLG